MTKKDKLIERFLLQPKDFSFNELTRLFNTLGFYIDTKGKTSGSRVIFINEEKVLSYSVHKPHPSNIIKMYVMRQVLDFLLDNDLLIKEEEE
ncbi:type II toxin-antitoxin system HicA family toxin [Bacteroides sp. 519]|uniref:type II toxin-antitoxin system HicA family toxin n=1 Tax=Bacteroides sp. 519 TaxID=2302937 RepID=UPI0013D68AF8|nr:type II toxin-antitoxin system HicA family toxin [Bacteroides sp. 519]NDV59989.1 type II toxin-antitoxin system HicA family toxin [Bacteroides sp. 519]